MSSSNNGKYLNVTKLFFFVHLFTPILFSLCLSRTSVYTTSIYPLHFFHYWFYLSVVITISTVIYHVFPKIIGKILTSAILSSFDFFIILIYSLNLISISNWKSNVTMEFVISLPRHLISLGESVGAPGMAFPAVIIFVFLSLFSIYALSVDKIFNNITSLIKRAPNNVKKRYATYYILAIGFGIFYFQITFDNLTGGIWKGDPLTQLFLEPRTVFLSEPKRIAERNYDIRVHKNYNTMQSSGDLPTKPNVILIIVDALRSDHMGVYGYERNTTPFLSSLEKSDHLSKVQFVTSSCSDSLCGIVSILSSREYQFISYDLFKLNDVLRESGYYVEFLLSSSHYFLGKKKLYGANIDRYVDGTSFNRESMHDDRGIIDALADTETYDGIPHFFYFHLMSAHLLGVKFEQYNLFNSPSYIEKYNLSKGSEERLTNEINFYDAGIFQADSIIKNILEILESKKYLENAIVVITGDHGDGLGERGNYTHMEYLYQEDIGIPLLIYDTSNYQYANLEFATHIDIAPTVIDRLGYAIPESWHGVSLTQPLKLPRFTNHHTHGNNVQKAIIKKTNEHIYKYLESENLSSGLKSGELFELNQDPHETKNLINSGREDILKPILEEYHRVFD